MMLSSRVRTFLVIAFAAACSSAPAVDRPNVVLIISDDQAWTDFGFMGHEVIKTPNLDRLASQGLLFRNAYVTAPLCRPSLASIITGRYGHQSMICCNDPPKGVDRLATHRFLQRAPTIPRLLKKAGYRSLQTGKFWEGHYRNAGFTHGMTTEGHRHGGPGLTIGRKGLQPIYDFIDESGETPFFIWYAPFMPHSPHNPPDRILKEYAVDGRNIKLARYWAMCEWFDETCGELLGYLDKKGLAENTLVVFIVDNGWIQETGPVKRTRGWFAPKSKLSPYDGGLRTPVIVKWPGHLKPGQRDHLASAVDLAPTILNACGVEPPTELPGLNLLDLAAERSHHRGRAVFGEVFGHTAVVLGDPARNLTHRWVRQGDFKLIVPEDTNRQVELYNLSEDPTEEKNLAESNPQRVRHLIRLLDAWWKPEPGERTPGGTGRLTGHDGPKTAKGTPVTHMWDCPRPDPTKPGAGFPVLKGVNHSIVYRATRETGAYSHHSQLIWHEGLFFAMWSNHPYGEDGPGQRVLFSTSRDARTWRPWKELFPPPEPVKQSELTGLALAAGRWLQHEGRLYAVAGCHANMGFENPDRTSRSEVRSKTHPFRARRGHSPFVREVRGDGTPGPIFALNENIPSKGDLAFASLSSTDPRVAGPASALAELMPERKYPQGVDSNRLCEPTFYTAKDGKAVVLLRDDNYSHRMYVSISPDGGKSWPAAVPTDIPDSPSRTTNVVLDDGTVLLIGNQMAPQFDNPERPHYGRDPLTVAVSGDGYWFERVFALRCGKQKYRVPQHSVRGRGGGGQYPSAIAQKDTLYVLYSMGKEDIAVSWVPLAALR